MLEREELPGPRQWEAMVNTALEALEAGAIEKVVLSRRLRLRLAQAPDPAEVLARLAESSPHATAFAARCQGAVFLGASPELLVARMGGQVRSEALAGSATEDDRLATTKNLAEHALTIAGIQRTLQTFCQACHVAPEPRVLSLRHVRHLKTPIEGRLRDPTTNALQLALALHPTPAVGGTPTTRAREMIHRLEGTSRGWYAGALGWIDARGDGAFRVALRCGRLEGSTAWLHAGAGIVPGSRPAAEFRETEIKFRPLLAALGALER
ncbi:MAG: isochorismate synthase [Acidobacteriota bacterium]|nr:isochorismate synthase [Acidobacteriota bacterium]